ncbi:hypothetical protein QEG73_24185 [Chitinophagaceae bacterium 26-R-25]|nr:hypothetical protein [Chitinophagaceae bacterium 26-R-25]
MKSIEVLLTALRIWFFTVIINAVMIGAWTRQWSEVFAILIVGAIITIPIPFVANYCIKLACMLSNTFGARFLNTYFFLVLLAGLFWAVLIAIFGARGFGDLQMIIGLNFLSILIACIFSIKPLRKLNDVTSEETVIS